MPTTGGDGGIDPIIDGGPGGTALGVGGAGAGPVAVTLLAAALGSALALGTPGASQSGSAGGSAVASATGTAMSATAVAGTALGSAAASAAALGVGSPQGVCGGAASAVASALRALLATASCLGSSAAGASGLGRPPVYARGEGFASAAPQPALPYTYTVQRARDSAFTVGLVTLAAGLTAHTYTDPMTPADDGITYYYRVYAVSAAGAGTPLGPITVTTVCPASAPHGCSCHWTAGATPCAGWGGRVLPGAAWTRHDGAATTWTPKEEC